MNVIPGIYRHYSGKYYKVLYLARHTETNEELVVYHQTSPDKEEIWVRPKKMFGEYIDSGVKRFTFIGNF